MLILTTAGRMFALTFGSGRFLLRPGSYERGWGLRAARNLVEIRSVQSRRLADVALQVRRQVSRPSDIVGLDVDLQRDLLSTLERG